ncbi:MAG: sigma 54-dependent Fis family transcriptional regulator [Labilithrix sp.]|nr:sigma 54-dependent Fis family transcriptional regulator [Labilithrix sp.]
MSDGRDESTTRAASLDDLHLLVVRGAEIAVLSGPEAGREVRVQGGVTVVGSGQACDLRISDDLVSRKHLEIHSEARGVRVVDRGSRNGTFFHGARVGEMIVTESAELVVGGTKLRIRVDGEAVKLPFSRRTTFGSAVAHSEAMRHVFRVLELAAVKDVTVLLEGESGTGKEVLASAIHQESARRDGPFVVVDCGSIAPNLVESELFGHERGAFTGAVATHHGAFERAHGGTIFLDELGELPLDAQPKLLRALESRSIRRVGGKDTISFDARVVAATNRRLKEAVRLKEFRQDLFYRLAVVHVVVPRLADRREDVPPLAERFLRQATNDASATLPEDLTRLLTAYAWPGNVRELRNVIERFATFRDHDPAMLFGRLSDPGAAAGAMLDIESLGHLPYPEAKQRLLDAYHRAVIPRVVAEAGGSVPKAAEKLGMSRTNLYRVLQELGTDVDDD